MLRRLPGRRIALLGRMAELGEHEGSEHRRMGTIAAECCDVLAAVSEPCRAMVEAAREGGLAAATWYGEKDEAARAVAHELRAEDHVLVKASRSQAFETILPILEGAA
jgi:UDP-N-acetylmuramoyl-tripeptide--D-alanyl-D-alanine ligase